MHTQFMSQHLQLSLCSVMADAMTDAVLVIADTQHPVLRAAMLPFRQQQPGVHPAGFQPSGTPPSLTPAL